MSPEPLRASWRRRLLVPCLALGLAMIPALLYAQEAPPVQPQQNRALEILEEIQKAQLPVPAVRTDAAGNYTLEFPEGCPAQAMAQAEAIKRRVLAEQPATIVVDNLQDALVVLYHEPQNASAREVVRKRYDELRAQARGQ